MNTRCKQLMTKENLNERLSRSNRLLDKSSFVFIQGEVDSENDDEEDKISPEEVERPLPVSKDGLNFDALIRNKVELDHFQNFLETRHKQGEQ